ncbi:MAG: 2-oxoglutarate ferredoxin oxidoreductase subunit alpha, partial [Bacteroidetes bacterium]
DTAFEACRIAMQHMTPVILLSDGYIANGAEPWRYPQANDLPELKVQFAPPRDGSEETPFLPYARDERLVRAWAIPGTPGLTHRIGGLEKEDETGNVSYDPLNHEKMIHLREAKVEKIAEYVPEQTIEVGPDTGELLVVGWGSTYGVIRSVVRELVDEGHAVAHAHLRYIKPMPRNLGQLMGGFKKVLVPEMNRGQLAMVLREKFCRPIGQYNKIQGIPIAKAELREAILKALD